MSERKTLVLHENIASKNWPAGMRPEWADEHIRLYTGFKIHVAAHDWRQIVVEFNGKYTTAYVTNASFDLSRHGPAINNYYSDRACYRKVVREWFRGTYNMGVVFE
jgi:hypothetical protein